MPTFAAKYRRRATTSDVRISVISQSDTLWTLPLRYIKMSFLCNLLETNVIDDIQSQFCNSRVNIISYFGLLGFYPDNVGSVFPRNTLVSNSNTTWCHIPEDHSIYFHFYTVQEIKTKSNSQLLALVSFVFRDKILKQIHTLKC